MAHGSGTRHRTDVSLGGANAPTLSPLENKVRHELVMLPYINVFDDISFRVDGGTVTLFGEVTEPVLKSDAGNVVKRLEGVSKVDNQIEVLPLSPNDNRIRFRLTGQSSAMDRCTVMEWALSHRSTSSSKRQRNFDRSRLN